MRCGREPFLCGLLILVNTVYIYMLVSLSDVNGINCPPSNGPFDLRLLTNYKEMDGSESLNKG